jgi:hypothetical protein
LGGAASGSGSDRHHHLFIRDVAKFSVDIEANPNVPVPIIKH